MIDAVWDEETGVIRVERAEDGAALWDLGWYGRDPRTRGAPSSSSSNGDASEERWTRTVLTPCEAFFLSVLAEEPVVRVHAAQTGAVLDAQAQWAAYGALDAGFGAQLALYRYCRAGGWAPRAGVAHGVDLLLYRAGVRHSHAPFAAVLVRDGAAPLPAGVAQAARNVANVAKQLLVCRVAGALPLPAAWSRAALDAVRVDMVLLGRWDPDSDRDVPPDGVHP